MTSNYQKHIRICLTIGVSFLLLGSILFAALNQTEMIAASEECIRCHVTVFNQGIENREIHTPFWERKCVVCHLPDEASWPEKSLPITSGLITGTVVSQEDLWRKMQSYSAATELAYDQLVSLPSLESATAYRFRIVVSLSAKDTGGEVYSSLWLGLLPVEMADFSSTQQLEFSASLSQPFANFVRSASLYRSGEAIFVTWETTELLYGWVEVQKLEGLTLADLSSTAAVETRQTTISGQHPPLRDPVELAINACYQCHPASSLGTSHPVRLYSGQDVRIPDELPTVEGMMTCVTCHDPHGSSGKMLVRETIKTKLCVTCHYKYKNSSPSTMFD